MGQDYTIASIYFQNSFSFETWKISLIVHWLVLKEHCTVHKPRKFHNGHSLSFFLVYFLDTDSMTYSTVGGVYAKWNILVTQKFLDILREYIAIKIIYSTKGGIYANWSTLGIQILAQFHNGQSLSFIWVIAWYIFHSMTYTHSMIYFIW